DCAPYRQALVYEKLLDEKGEAMHRSRGNAIWFDEAVEKMGADVMRWLYISQPIENNLLFGYGPAESVMRRLLQLWNVYAFFVTYANIDRFDPSAHRSDPVQRSFIDRWILSRLNSLTKGCREALDAFDGATVTGLAESFIDDLSTWWLRRSRRRFWKTEEDQDKTDAYLTLHEALVALSRLLAPLIPFLCESLYQNLVRSTDNQAPLSVHLTLYPESVTERIDTGLERKMDLVKEIIGLGRAARNKVNLKVRQPLREMILVGLTCSEQSIVKELADIILEELNIKSLRCEDRLLGLQQFLLLPNLPILGPRFGKRLPEIRSALQELDAEQALATLASGQSLRLELPEGPIELLAGDVLVQRHDQPGFAAEASGHCLLALETELDEGLRQEGFARELVHAIQNLRKEVGFQVEDTIRIYYQSDPSLAPIWQNFSAYLQRETLSEALLEGIPADAPAQELRIEEKGVRLYLERVTK
ncbi:MAG: DUF5915 domain-containing protein, partial [Coprothermobacterota bacterium]|nr:DUF5915 domain-containing protein [Coprothermobacterota bacterium]